MSRYTFIESATNHFKDVLFSAETPRECSAEYASHRSHAYIYLFLEITLGPLVDYSTLISVLKVRFWL